MQNLEILYEDDYLLAINKKSGILVIPTFRNEKHTLTNLINFEIEKKGLNYKAHPCHRLDRETSGVILYAKGKNNQKIIMELFHKKEIQKKYVAVVRGKLSKPQGTLRQPIEGKTAITKYKVIQATPDYTTVDINLLTGRTNQIRIHFKNIGHPLIGESRFTFRKDFKIKFKRAALHAYEVSFLHPITKQKMIIQAPLALDLEKFFN